MPNQYTANPLIVPCQICGTRFRTSPSRQAEGRGKYCSRSCFYEGMRGERNATWQGGRSITPQGYVSITIPGVGPKLEHRWVMEQHLGRPLASNERVHHNNENKLDNRIENLKVVSPSEHAAIHRNGRWSIEHECCVSCGTTARLHQARGRCHSCYQRAFMQRAKHRRHSDLAET